MNKTHVSRKSTSELIEEGVAKDLIRRLRHQLGIAQNIGQYDLSEAGVHFVKHSVHATCTNLRDMGRGEDLHAVLAEMAPIGST